LAQAAGISRAQYKKARPLRNAGVKEDSRLKNKKIGRLAASWKRPWKRRSYCD
jgi:hypothetical protein